MLEDIRSKVMLFFMNPQGNRVLYHLTGLGMQYFRFKGLQNAVKYEGNNYLIGISTHTKSGNGLQASADMSHENIQKTPCFGTRYSYLRYISNKVARRYFVD